MDLGFTGQFQSKVDGKGRMSIPAKFRRVIEAGDPEWSPDKPMQAKILFGNHLGESLQIMTMNDFNIRMAKIIAMPDNNPNKSKLRRLMIGFSDELTIDKDGRVVMPLAFRKKMGVVEGELKFMGLGDFFQIWKLENFEASVNDDLDEWIAEQGDDFDPMSLVE
ncbi:cell division/cell wall cluster transcriptional repressor MraZ [Loktanella sp. SALINAS62]|nr:cell division/cell wall cluster transcriptional repressor MraZ [Loktanella sp. SALINAS62]